MDRSRLSSFKFLEDILLGSMKSRALYLALRLQIFDLLQESPLDLTEIIKRLDIKNEVALEKLMLALRCMKLVDCANGKYANSAHVSALFASPENNFSAFLLFLGAEIENRSAESLLLQMRENEEAQGDVVSLEEWRLYMQAMQNVGSISVEAIVKQLDLKNIQTLCDVGSGPGTYALAFAKANPNLQICLFDVEPSLRIAQENLTKSLFAGQFQFVAGSVLEENWGGPYDAIFLSHVIHLFNATEVLNILQTARRSLSPDGKIWIRDLYLNPEKTSPQLGVMLSFAVWTNGGAYAGEDIFEMLKKVGFKNAKYIYLHDDNQPHVIGNLIEAFA